MGDLASDNVSEMNVKHLVMLVAGISRFLTRLSAIPPFQEANLGLTEWVSLSIIAERSGLTNGQLANILGVSAQRINQITDSLSAMALISIKGSVEDARRKIISIRPEGTVRLRELNVKLKPIITVALSKRPLALSRASSLFNNILMRIATSAQPPRVATQQTKPRSTSPSRGPLRNLASSI